ncbi:helix-turn-helix domain-containing protein [Streptomyces sp. NA04227]|uniref:AraC-like ligand-binding domain-containing protein n=1 Tax=Streptomyces sp. NA04227 TaxID=2742136 RepID=UPI00159034FE|nr:helix-turn-helix domain-containing protein [Streptomyces sp. NA04227]QKW09173.1 helix-turn-helix domain-containing protein [Streptomyces sp. NA04227]
MIAREFRGEAHTGPELFACWQELARSSPTPTEIRTEDPDGFDARVKLLQLGETQVSYAHCGSLWSARTERLIRDRDAELYKLSLPLQGHSVLVQSGRTAVAAPGQFVLASSSLPYEGGNTMAQGPSRIVQIRVPRGQLPLPARTVDRMLATPLPAKAGFGHLLHRFLTTLETDSGQYGPNDGVRLGMVLLDLCAGLLTHFAEDERALSPEAHRRQLFLRTQDFVRRNLGEPDLSPETVAAAHHISVRHLYRLFAEHDLAVGSWIRHQRLEHCRRDLEDPGQYHLPVQVFAARWGFSHPAAFSRAFRTAYGTAPREYRERLRAHYIRITA